MINNDPHKKKEKGLVSVSTPRGGIMWVHPDLIENQQWMTVTNRKSKGKARAFSSNVVSAFAREIEEGIALLTSSGEEESPFTVNTGAPFTSKIRSGKQCLK